LNLKVTKMSEKYAREIVAWQYPKPYELYNLEVADVKELLNEDYNAIIDKTTQLVGFYCTGKTAQVPAGHQTNCYSNEFLDFGLGMKPELTGIGNGSTFLNFILFAIDEKSLRLTVTTFNLRAIKLYEKFGFIKRAQFSNGKTEFVVMCRD